MMIIYVKKYSVQFDQQYNKLNNTIKNLRRQSNEKVLQLPEQHLVPQL